MINLFNFASGDQSLQYLYYIFGSMNGLIPTPAGQAASTYAILPTLFKVFNSVVLSIGALVILYVTVMSVVMTAHEGEFMGKKWNNIWIFIRIVFGIALMVPSATGYCAIQFIFMWIILQGVGAADSIWNAALTYVNTFGSVYAQPAVVSAGTSQGMQTLFQDLVCESAARVSSPDPTNTTNGGYYCYSNPNDPICALTEPPVPDAEHTMVSFGPNGGVGSKTGACGLLTYCDASNTGSCSDANSLSCYVCKGQIAALGAAIKVLAGIADQFVQADYQYRNFYANSNTDTSSSDWSYVGQYCQANNIPPNECCNYVSPSDPFQKTLCQQNSNFANYPANSGGTNGSPQDADTNTIKGILWPYGMSNLASGPNFISTVVNDAYQATLQSNILNWSQQNAANQLNKTAMQGAQQRGWLSAGGFYYLLAQQNNSLAQGAQPTFQVESAYPDPSSPSSTMYKYRNDYTAAADLMAAASGSGNNNPQVQAVTGTIQGAAADSAQVFTGSTTFSSSTGGGSSMSWGTNPLMHLQHIGFTLLMVAEASFLALLVITTILGVTGNIDVWALGNGVMDSLGPTSILLYMVLVPVVLVFFGILISYGGLLAIYVPLIPFVIWLAAAVAWFMSVIEAMVAGPLVTLGMLSPNAQGHEILGKSEQAIAHIFNIFLRPSLMVFGLIAALLLACAMADLVDSGFSQIQGATLGGSVDPLSLILFYGAYIMVNVTMLNKTFALIYYIPQQVMYWMGLHHQGGQVEAQGLLDAGRQGQQQFGEYAAGGMKSGAMEPGRAAFTARKAEEAKGKKAQSAADNTTVSGNQPPGNQNPGGGGNP
jgi:hypothetical protein